MMMMNDSHKKSVVKALSAGLIAYGLSHLNNEQGSLSILGYDVPTSMAIGGATGLASVVVEPVKNVVLPVVESNQYLRNLEGRALDVLVGGALPVAFLYLNGNRPANMMGLGTTFAYGAAGTIGGQYVADSLI